MQVHIKRPQDDDFAQLHYVNEMSSFDDTGATKIRQDRFGTAMEAFADAALTASRFDTITMSGGVLRDFLHEAANKYKQEQS